MAYSMKGISGFNDKTKRKQKKQERKESRAHNKSARKAFREDNPGFLNRLFGKYKIK